MSTRSCNVQNRAQSWNLVFPPIARKSRFYQLEESCDLWDVLQLDYKFLRFGHSQAKILLSRAEFINIPEIFLTGQNC